MSRPNRFAALGGVPTEDVTPQPEAPDPSPVASRYDWSRVEALQVRLARGLKRRFQDLVFRADDDLRGVTQEEYAAALIHLALEDGQLQARVIEQAREFRRERLG